MDCMPNALPCYTWAEVRKDDSQAGRWKEELFIKRLQYLNYLEIAQNSKLLLDTVIKSILFETSKAMKFIWLEQKRTTSTNSSQIQSQIHILLMNAFMSGYTSLL